MYMLGAAALRHCSMYVSHHTHGASSILKLNANMWPNIKAIDFMRGLKRKFICSVVDSFKLNATAGISVVAFAAAAVHNVQEIAKLEFSTAYGLFGFIETKIFGRHTCRRILFMSLFCVRSVQPPASHSK